MAKIVLPEIVNPIIPVARQAYVVRHKDGETNYLGIINVSGNEMVVLIDNFGFITYPSSSFCDFTFIKQVETIKVY